MNFHFCVNYQSSTQSPAVCQFAYIILHPKSMYSFCEEKEDTFKSVAEE